MKNIILAIIALSITSCQSIVVWTVKDIVGLSLFALIALFILVVVIWSKIENWRRRWMVQYFDKGESKQKYFFFYRNSDKFVFGLRRAGYRGQYCITKLTKTKTKQ